MLIPTSFFLFDISKVLIDLLFLCLHGWLLAYIFFIASPLLARDIEQHVCHIFLTLPMSRSHYFWARFTGIIAGILPLLITYLIASFFTFIFAESIWGSYIHPQANSSFIYGTFLILLPYIALSAILFLIASKASVLPAITVFFFAIWFFCWLVPPVLGAMQDAEVQQSTPDLIVTMIHLIHQLLPDLSSAEISLNLAHSHNFEALQVISYCTHHLAYAVLAMLLATISFNRRDLA